MAPFEDFLNFGGRSEIKTVSIDPLIGQRIRKNENRSWGILIYTNEWFAFALSAMIFDSSVLSASTAQLICWPSSDNEGPADWTFRILFMNFDRVEFVLWVSENVSSLFC